MEVKFKPFTSRKRSKKWVREEGHLTISKDCTSRSEKISLKEWGEMKVKNIEL